MVEYIDTEHARIDYAGGRFCYRMDARIDIELPADAVPVRAMIYDLHQPDEIIQITFTHLERRMSPDAEPELPGKDGDRKGNHLALRDGEPREHAEATTTGKPATPGTGASGSSQHRSQQPNRQLNTDN